MSLENHRSKEYLGGVVHLLSIDMRELTGDPTHILRIVNHYGEDGSGVQYQGNQYIPHPYKLDKVSKTAKDNKSGAKITIGDNEDFSFSRFIENVGGDLQGAKVLELRVFSKFLDNSPDANSMAYIKRLDHVINYLEDSDTLGEVIVHTLDPLSRELDVPTISFTAGEPNSTESAINIFPAVDRNISQKRG